MVAGSVVFTKSEISDSPTQAAIHRFLRALGIEGLREVAQANAERRMENSHTSASIRQALRSKNYAALEREAKRTLERNPYNRDGLQLLALAYLCSKQTERLDECLQDVERNLPPTQAAEIIRFCADESGFDSLGLGIKDIETAERYYRRACKLDPNNAVTKNNFGYMLAEHGTKLDEAEVLIRAALQDEPNNTVFVDSLGWVYYKRGEYNRAARELGRAVNLAKNNNLRSSGTADLHYHLGMALWKMNRVGEARQAFRNAIDLAPQHNDAREALKELEKTSHRNVTQQLEQGWWLPT